MPLGDGTGPLGLGPRTGRAMGYCSGFSIPGFMNPGFGNGFGRGFGFRRFWRGFRGRGFGWRFFMPISEMSQQFQQQSLNKKEELQMLKEEAKAIEEEQKALVEELEEIKKRIKEITKKNDKK